MELHISRAGLTPRDSAAAVFAVHQHIGGSASSKALKVGCGGYSKSPNTLWQFLALERRGDQSHLRMLTNLQDELLDAASNLVKPGGVLIYNTCSIDPSENEARIAAFLLRHPEFYVEHIDDFVSSTFLSEEGFYMLNPVKHSLDGAFAARLSRSA